MMNIRSFFSEEKPQPQAGAFFRNETGRVMLIRFKAGQILKEHKTPVPARLLVLEGKVEYGTKEGTTELEQLQYYDIPAGELHEVRAFEDSYCLVMR